MLPYNAKVTKYFFMLFVLLILAYAYFEAHNMFSGPNIKISAPESGFTVNSQLVEITGSVSNVTDFRLDGNIIEVDKTGKFTKKLLLAPGENIFTFVAKDKFDRINKEMLYIFYKVKKDN